MCFLNPVYSDYLIIKKNIFCLFYIYYLLKILENNKAKILENVVQLNKALSSELNGSDKRVDGVEKAVKSFHQSVKEYSQCRFAQCVPFPRAFHPKKVFCDGWGCDC